MEISRVHRKMLQMDLGILTPPVLLVSSRTPSQVSLGNGCKVGPDARGGGPLQENKKWTDLLFSKLKGKSIALVAHVVDPSSARCSILIPDELVDKGIASMGCSLVGKFVCPRPNIDSIRSWVARKWKNKGQIDVLFMEKGFFSFSFTYEEDLVSVLSSGPWS
ncbi:hypothetical protein SUGI_0500870 [Cryptomeria japonica]|nr:hypothetical protein SUGI_0500870 [Cryptomeria japonica]